MKKSELFGNTTDIAWNPRVAHIIAAASDAGVVSIIDLRSKKEVTHIKLPNFASASSIAWNPDTVNLGLNLLLIRIILAHQHCC